MRAWCVVLVLAACGNLNSNGDGNGYFPPDGSCGAELQVSPEQPFASPTTLITATASGGDGRAYTWKVERGVEAVAFAFPAATTDTSVIEFIADTPGLYTITAYLGVDCASASKAITVQAPNMNTGFLRLRAVAPLDMAAAPLDVLRPVTLDEQSYDLGDLLLEGGVFVNAQVRGPAGGVAGYVRFSPNGMPDAMVEAFADGSGAVTASLAIQPQTVLVVPSDRALAPRRFAQWSPALPTPLVVDAGTPFHGTVLDRDGAPLAGAAVQLTIDDLPSTVATTDASGAFTVGTTASGTATISVAPPAGRGLPRLSATGAFADGVTVRYTGAITRDLAGLVVRAHGAPLATTEVTVVGSFTRQGTVGAVQAGGDLRLRARTDAAGRLPALLVPAAPLSLVVTDDSGTLLAPLDVTTSVPASATLPDAQAWVTLVRGPDNLPLDGAIVELAPTGPLALAGAPALQLRANASGELHGSTPPGARYDLRFRDLHGRAAPIELLDRAPSELATFTLSGARTLRGRLRMASVPLAGGAVQLMCMGCQGSARARPIVEALSDASGAFTLAVPLTGTR